MSAPELERRWFMEQFKDNDQHSVRADVQVLQDKISGATNRLARLRKALDAMERDLTALFRRMDENRQELAEAGLVAQHALSPMLEQAYRAYLRAESEQPLPRVFTEIPDPPIGPELP